MLLSSYHHELFRGYYHWQKWCPCKTRLEVKVTEVKTQLSRFHSHQWIQAGVIVRKHPILVKSDDFLAVWPWNLTDDLEKQMGTSSMLLFPSFRSHWWIQTGVTVHKRPIWVKIDDLIFFSCVTLKFHGWPWKTIGHLCSIRLCASFYLHMSIQTGFTVRKRLNWVLTYVTLTSDLDLLHGPHFRHW